MDSWSPAMESVAYRRLHKAKQNPVVISSSTGPSELGLKWSFPSGITSWTCLLTKLLSFLWTFSLQGHHESVLRCWIVYCYKLCTLLQTIVKIIYGVKMASVSVINVGNISANATGGRNVEKGFGGPAWCLRTYTERVSGKSLILYTIPTFSYFTPLPRVSQGFIGTSFLILSVCNFMEYAIYS